MAYDTVLLSIRLLVKKQSVQWVGLARVRSNTGFTLLQVSIQDLEPGIQNGDPAFATELEGQFNSNSLAC
jgi:hypothetical protein